jgi:hypothetical protein
MRAGEDAISVMDDVQRTHSSRLSTRPPATPSRADADRRSPRSRR